MNPFCEWLHQALEALPMFTYPYRRECIPPNGIYFMYEAGETYGIEGNMLRIVRVGTHIGPGNLPKRLKEHFSPPDSWMNFGIDHLKPADRSVFRKNIGRAYLNRSHDQYLNVWNIDYFIKENRIDKGHLRDINKERSLEKQITEWIRRKMTFRFIIINDDKLRERIEKCCIGTVAYSTGCQPSTT